MWYQRAVQLDDADANLEIAKILLRDKHGIKKAVPYLKRTIRAKSIDATEGAKLEARHLLKQLKINKSTQSPVLNSCSFQIRIDA